MEGDTFVTPGEVLGKAAELRAGRGAYVSAHDKTVYASLTGFISITPALPESADQVNYLKKPIFVMMFWC